MRNIKTEIIITKTVLNNKTGEIKEEEFVQKKSIIDMIKGGWRKILIIFC